MLTSLWNYLRRMTRDSILAGASDALKELHQADNHQQFNSGVLDLHERLNALDLTVPRLENGRPHNGQAKGRKTK